MPTIQVAHFSLDSVLLFSSLLLVFAVLMSRISSSFGIPALLLFLILGMLAGSEGLGGVPFNNYSLAFFVGSSGLAFIIFDGGLRTSWRDVRPVLLLGISLSFVGTVVTGLVTGAFAHYLLGLTWTESLLLGAIVSSTDAAAVFSTLRSKGLGLRGSLKQTLEFEAASNDPVAVFLTVAVLTYMNSPNDGLESIVILFFKQTALGLLFGWYGGKAIHWIINHAGVEFEGLYGVLMLGLVMVLFSLTSSAGGSGFLAVYVAGLFLGNVDYLHKDTIIRFLDGVAWISQIVIFLVLGLLVFPSKLFSIWKEGLILAFFMAFVARPISVLIAAPGKILDTKSRLFVSWIGLRGAAPIILATLPWSMGLAKAEYFFDMVFFIVLISVILQGVSIPWIATKLEVTEPIKEDFAPRMGQLLPLGFIPIEVMVSEEALAHDRRIVDLKLPAGVVLTSLERKGRYLVPQGRSRLFSGDKLRGFARQSNIDKLKDLFGSIEVSQN